MSYQLLNFVGPIFLSPDRLGRVSDLSVATPPWSAGRCPIREPPRGGVAYGQGYGDRRTSPLVTLGLLLLATLILLAIVLMTHLG